MTEATRKLSNGATRVDVRIVSATHRSIEAAIAENRFREDLYFRLGVIPLRVPDLASRVSDIPALVSHFQRNTARARGVSFDASALEALMRYSWPGNVRELRNIVERAGALYFGRGIGAREVRGLISLGSVSATGEDDDVPMAPAPPLTLVSEAPAVAAPAFPINLKEMVGRIELERIELALASADGVIAEAARMLTLKRTTLIEKMRKYGVGKQAA